MSEYGNGTGMNRKPVKRAPSAGARPAPAGQRASSANTARPVSSVKRTRPAGAPAKRPAAAKPASSRSVSAPQSPAAAPQRRGGSKGPDWQVLLILGGCVLALIAIITLLVFGIVRCAKGCNSEDEKPQNLQIVLSETPVPSDYESQPVSNIVDIPDAPDPSGEAVQPQATEQPAINYVPGTGGNVREEYTGTLRRATIRNIGDFVIHKEVFQHASRLASATGVNYPYNFAPMLNYIRDVMTNADFTVVNVDGSLGGKQYYKYGYSGYPQFNTPPYILYALQDAGVDMLTLANNHMLDGWFDGLKATMDNVESVNIKHVGANRTQEERNTPKIFEINGIKVGILNYTESLNSMERAAGLSKEALEYGVNWTRNSDVNKDAKAMREAGAEVIVCYMHWGEEYENDPGDRQKGLAKALVGAGVDVIIGGHPHVVQYAEWLNGTNQFGESQRTLCLYSLGNFLSDQRLRYRDGGIIFDFTIQEKADGTFDIINPSYIPTWVWKTGTDANNFTYSVVPIDQFAANLPPEMNSTDYQTMLQSYNDSIYAMSKGVGTRITE